VTTALSGKTLQIIVSNVYKNLYQLFPLTALSLPYADSKSMKKHRSITQ